MLGGQEHNVIGPADPVGGHQFDRRDKISERAFNLETVLGKLGGALAADQKRHVAARLGKSPAEIAADRAGAEHEKAHLRLRVTFVPPLSERRKIADYASQSIAGRAI